MASKFKQVFICEYAPAIILAVIALGAHIEQSRAKGLENKPKMD